MVGDGWIAEDGTPRHEFKTPEQGAATSLWCATSPQLDGMGGLYCEGAWTSSRCSCSSAKRSHSFPAPARTRSAYSRTLRIERFLIEQDDRVKHYEIVAGPE
jgi:hypothetical protein